MRGPSRHKGAVVVFVPVLVVLALSVGVAVVAVVAASFLVAVVGPWQYIVPEPNERTYDNHHHYPHFH